MKLKHKQSYTTPVSDVVEVKPQGMLCTSPLTYYFLLSGTLSGYEDGGADTWTMPQQN